MALAAQKEVDKKTQKLQLTYQVNFAQALSKMKNQLVIFILNVSEGIIVLILIKISRHYAQRQDLNK
jgi:hypothetical protein